jgi:hypothetical protein
VISVVVVDNVRVQEECSSSWGMSPLTLDWTVLRLVDNRLLRRSSGGKQTATSPPSAGVGAGRSRTGGQRRQCDGPLVLGRAPASFSCL